MSLLTIQKRNFLPLIKPLAIIELPLIFSLDVVLSPFALPAYFNPAYMKDLRSARISSTDS
jgi:hypothetical protein